MSNGTPPEMQPTKDNEIFRAFIGILALGAGIAGFGILFFIEIPPRNENALMFALGIVFGWGSAVIASEYGATTTGRKVAESAIRKIERQDIASGEISEVTITNTEDDPVPVKEKKK